MSKYQVIARKYRPQIFKDVLGQDAIVKTLKNAIKRNKVAHAYLFCGSRGTGKTTLARIFAKALNCQNPTDDHEPCNQCTSCKEITAGSSMDVLEIDGASHRGIDDIRQINETVGYATASGKFKIYIIDEVHMLTKEAFNALLKTLEEPPPKVIFFFATTEPHKVLPTILSRCQRYNLNRIPVANIIQKLRYIADEMQVTVQDDALRLLACSVDGGLRDAESLFDQILAFHEGEITVNSVADILGIMTRDCFFDLDRAAKEGNLAMAFEIAHQVVSQGKDIIHFVEDLAEHFRNILGVKLAGKNAPFLTISEAEREKYEASARLYTQEQCLTILDFLIEAYNQRYVTSARVALESILLRVIRIHQRVPVDFLVKRLTELEQQLNGNAPKEIPKPKNIESSISEDPTPTKADLGIKEKPQLPKIENNPAPIELGSRPTPEAIAVSNQQQSRYDTLLQFATIELEGTIQKKQYRG